MSVRGYPTLKALRAGETIDIGGIRLKADEDQEISSGDMYVAERNSGPQWLTAREVDLDKGFIIPTTSDYAFDLPECVKVCEA